MFYEKVLDKMYFIKLNNVFQTSSKRLVESLPICLVFKCLSYVPFCVLMFYSLNFAIAHAQKKIVMLIRIGHNCVA